MGGWVGGWKQSKASSSVWWVGGLAFTCAFVLFGYDRVAHGQETEERLESLLLDFAPASLLFLGRGGWVGGWVGELCLCN